MIIFELGDRNNGSSIGVSAKLLVRVFLLFLI
jgi:hypothetical protein